MPNRLVGAKPPVAMPALMAMAITTGSTRDRRATGMPTGASTRPACGDPIAAIAAVSAKNTNGSAIGRAPARASTVSITRSMVPLTCAMPKKYVTPASRIMMLIGNPPTTSCSGMPASVTPTAHATGNIRMPR